jgi:transcriptional regulator with XRE-family HTH domain
MDVGTALQDARERRGLSLAQLSQATKISVPILRAIEHNQIDQLPDGIFLRGFLRAYAREVGLNPDDTVGRYLGQFAPVPAVAKRGSGEACVQPGPAVHGAIDQAAPERQAVRVPGLVVRLRLRPFTSALLPSMSMVVLVISLVGAYTFARWWASAPSPALPVTHPQAGAIPRSPSPADASTAATAGGSEATTAGSSAPTMAAASGVALLHVDIRPQGLCWLSATVDGTRVVYRLMQPGEQQTIEVRDEAVLRVGNPAAFTFSINGMAGRSLSPGNEPVTLHITTQNYREFLRR